MVLYFVEEAPAQVTLTQLARKRKPAKQTSAALRKKQAVPVAPAASPGPTVATLVPSVYAGDGQPGDFVWEINEAISSSAHAATNNRTLWVFNDNEQDRLSNKLGAGNAQIRPFNKFGVHSAAPLSAGVTTGSSGVGYASLSPCAERVINADILLIQKLLATGEYSSVKYSSDVSGLLGTSIFPSALMLTATLCGASGVLSGLQVLALATMSFTRANSIRIA